MKRIFGFVLSIWVSVGVSAQHTLTLDSCRAMALKSNKRATHIRRENKCGAL